MLARLCRTGITADSTANLLNAKRQRRKADRTKRQVHNVRLLLIDVENIRAQMEGAPVASKKPYQQKRPAMNNADRVYRANIVSVRKRRKKASDVVNKKNMDPHEIEHTSRVFDDASEPKKPEREKHRIDNFFDHSYSDGGDLTDPTRPRHHYRSQVLHQITRNTHSKSPTRYATMIELKRSLKAHRFLIAA